MTDAKYCPSIGTLVQVTIVAASVRMLYVLVCGLLGGPDAFLAEDSIQYLRQGAIALGSDAPFGFGETGAAVYDPQILPLIPLLLYLLGVASEAEIWRFIALQVALDTGTCLIVAVAATSVPGVSARCAGLLAALNPTQVVMVGLALTDTVTLFFLAIALLGAVRLVSDSRPRLVLISSTVVFGIVGAGYARYATVPMSLILCAVTFCILVSLGRGGVRRIVTLVVVALVSWAALQPIPLRNQATFGHHEFSDQYGVHMLYWVVPYARDLGAGIPRDITLNEAQRRYEESVLLHGEPRDSFEKTKLMNDVGVTMFWESGITTLGLAWGIGASLNILSPAVAAAPWARELKTGSFTNTSGEHGFDKVLNFISDTGNSTYAFLMGIGALGGLVWAGLGLAGAGRIVLMNARVGIFLLIWMAVVLAIAGPIISPKYRLPLEPVWSLLAAAAIPILWARLKGVRNAVR